MTTLLHWLPRTLGILFAAFLSLFALEVPDLVTVLIQLIPSVLILLAVAIGWKRPRLGGIVFLAMAVTVTFFFHTYRHVGTLLVLTGPLVLVGVLFLVQGWIGRKKSA